MKLEGKAWEAPVMFSMSSVNLLWPYTYITAINSRKAIRVRPVAPKLKIENQGEPSGVKVFSRWERNVQRQEKCSLMMLALLFGYYMDWTPTCRRE